MKNWCTSFLLSIISISAIAEDIELYVGETHQRSGERPQVLIIFDTSGSMTTEETVRDDFVPADWSDNGYVYYSSDSDVPSLSSNKRFLAEDNGCASSFEAIASKGFFTDHIGRYRANRDDWRKLPRDPSNPLSSGQYIDCEDDIATLNLTNGDGVIDGLPSNDTVNLENPPPYATSPSATPNFDTAHTLYSARYVNWYHNSSSTTRSRMAIAKDVITDLIESAPGVTFGLQVFNKNNSNSNSGGRIAYGIKSEDDYNSASLVDIIDDDIYADGNTPLCESLYEAMLYFGGQSAEYGELDSSREPKLDSTVISSGVYNSPYAGCSNEIFVILMTDGQPWEDTTADNLVKALTGTQDGNYLDDLAGYIHNNDINPNLSGKQIATTYTIGYGEDAIGDAGELLEDTASNGGGKYYPVSDPGDLLENLQSALLEILNVSTSFTSPSVASNNFDRTETLDSVYYAMFLPDRNPRWSGNLKKLRVDDDKQVDRNGNLAIDSSGNIISTAKTYWSSSSEADGGDVQAGGVAEMLRSTSNRKLLSDLGESGALVEFSYDNAISSTAFQSAELLATELGVDKTALPNHFAWAAGIDVDDEDDDGSTTDTRFDIFGDPLHSKPLVLNFGGSADNQDVRILVGTNAGFLHMFKDSGNTVTESWAFMPKELFENIPLLRENAEGGEKVYGMDGSATIHIYDANGDGTIDKTNDKVWIFIGMRRGGSSYYAIDVSDPDNPEYMWQITNSSTFAQLNQSWSRPTLGYSKYNVDNSGNLKPVLFFAAGYDTRKDADGVGSEDAKGKGVYMVDAETGDFLWSITSDDTDSNAGNTKLAGLEDSIPSGVSILDSDSDGLADRLYFGDTGGNLWRVDMPGDNPFSTELPWQGFKLAQLGGDTLASDRRFFDSASIARAIFTETTTVTEVDSEGVETTKVARYEQPFDAILIGSGDRSSPTDTDTHDKFFMIKDPNIATKNFTANEGKFPDPVLITDLYDYTDNPFENVSDSAAYDALSKSVSDKSGWYISYSADGEKSMSSATAVAGVAYFNSFTPADSVVDNQCELKAGAGTLYAVDLAYGTNVYDWRTIDVGDKVPDTPTIVIPPSDSFEDGESRSGKLRFIGVGSGTGEGTVTLCDAQDCDPVEGIRLETMRTHLYIDEN